MKNITEKTDKLYEYSKELPLTNDETEMISITYNSFTSLELSTRNIDPAIRTKLLKSQYKILKQLVKRAERRLFLSLTPFDAFIYRYLLKKKPLLPIYKIYNFSPIEIRQRLSEGISLGSQETITDNQLMPSINSKLVFHSLNGLLGIAKNFLISVKPQNLHEKTLSNFLDKVFDSYNFIPYHNFAHAINVLQFFDHILRRIPVISAHYTPEKKFWAMIACICHDITHYGKNNNYYIKKKHNLAFKSLEKSVLEHYHCEKTLKIMSNSSCDIMASTDNAQKPYLKRLMIEAILATDMTNHFGLLEKFNKIDLTNNISDDEVIVLTGYLVHSSDIANPALDFDNYILWSELVSQEFNLQIMSEKKHNLPLSPFFEYGGRESFLKGQCGFISTFTMPLFKAIADKTGNQEFERQCIENLKTVNEMLVRKTEDKNCE